MDKPKRTEIRELGGGAFLPAGFAVLSSTMFKFACQMANESETTAFRPVMAMPMAAVVHSAGALEALLNEELEKALTTWATNWASTIEALDRLDVGDKWVVVPKLLYNRTLDKSCEPYQSLRGLFDLRNALMHYRPVATADVYVPKRVDALSSRFDFHPEVDQDWTSKVLTPSCARWACRTARNVAREFFRIAGAEEIWPALEQMSWSLPPEFESEK